MSIARHDMQRPVARRHRRAGRLRQDRADRRLCKPCATRYDIAVVTNDIYTKEDARVPDPRRARCRRSASSGVETGGCPHTAIREDASINLAAVAEMRARFPDLDLIFIESGGDNLAATFSPELADLTIYVIDVSAGDKIPRKGGPGITRSDLLVINKIDLAPLVGADLDVMDRDARKMRGARPFGFTNLKENSGVAEIADFIVRAGGLAPAHPSRNGVPKMRKLALVFALVMAAGIKAAGRARLRRVGRRPGRGLPHPLGGLDHMLAMVAVGLWATQQGGGRNGRYRAPSSWR